MGELSFIHNHRIYCHFFLESCFAKPHISSEKAGYNSPILLHFPGRFVELLSSLEPSSYAVQPWE